MARFVHIDITNSMLAENDNGSRPYSRNGKPIASDHHSMTAFRLANAVIVTSALPVMDPRPQQGPGTSHFGVEPPKFAKPPACSFSAAL
jgi:hypothetical protein